jgi:hypothetical protein
MKKVLPVVLMIILLSSCSSLSPIIDLIVSPTPPPADTPTPQPTVTRIPTRDLFATLTPTPVTFTPTETPFIPDQPATATPSLVSTIPPPSTVQGSTLFTPVNNGFLTVLISSGVIYWNTGPCAPRSLTVTAYVGDLVHTDKVYLWMRAREKSDTMLLGDWSSGEMLQDENGSFSYTVTALSIRKYIHFRNAWIEYQLISYDEDSKELARTQIYERSMSLILCGP